MLPYPLKTPVHHRWSHNGRRLMQMGFLWSVPPVQQQQYWQSLTAKSKRRNVFQILNLLNLTGGMTQKCQGTWSLSIPPPLSVIRIIFLPPSVISTVTAVAPASIAFSTSSFTMEDGRSTTSPAAILSMVCWSNTAIFLNFYHHLFLILFCRL